MASFTLFDKTVYTGIEPKDVGRKKGPHVASPVDGVEWQVLTDSGMRMSCTGFGALLQWRHPRVPIKAVSHKGQPWRKYTGFRRQLERGLRPEMAFDSADWLVEELPDEGE